MSIKEKEKRTMDGNEEKVKKRKRTFQGKRMRERKKKTNRYKSNGTSRTLG